MNTMKFRVPVQTENRSQLLQDYIKEKSLEISFLTKNEFINFFERNKYTDKVKADYFSIIIPEDVFNSSTDLKNYL